AEQEAPTLAEQAPEQQSPSLTESIGVASQLPAPTPAQQAPEQESASPAFVPEQRRPPPIVAVTEPLPVRVAQADAELARAREPTRAPPPSSTPRRASGAAVHAAAQV